MEGWERGEKLSIRKTWKPCPYFERTEELRNTAAKVLKEADDMTIHELHKKLKNFNVPTTTCLAAVLRQDPRKRFKSKNKIWQTL